MKKIIIYGPILSRSGYGEMARFAYKCLKAQPEKYEVYVNPTNWGVNGSIPVNSQISKDVYADTKKTQMYVNENKNKNQMTLFDMSLQVTIPNEWKKLAMYNIGYTAGIETTLISPAWLEPSNSMDKIIVISNHAKKSFNDTVFGNARGNKFIVTTPIEVCHFPVKNVDNVELDIDFKNDFNFLSVCQWSPRKNLEQLIHGFLEEFKDEEVGLVLKVNITNDSLIDKQDCENKLLEILAKFPNRKCNVSLLHGAMSESEINSLYRHPKIKAIVSSTHGEGFGFPLFEAVYNELPVIATNWSGHLDFLSAIESDGEVKSLFGKVDCEIKPIQKEYTWKGVLEEGSCWAYPNHSTLKSRMRELYKDHGRFKSWAKRLNNYVRQEFSEEKIVEKFVSCVDMPKDEVEAI